MVTCHPYSFGFFCGSSSQQTVLLGTMQVPGTMHDATPSGNRTLLPSTCDPSYLFTKRTGETAVNIIFILHF